MAETDYLDPTLEPQTDVVPGTPESTGQLVRADMLGRAERRNRILALRRKGFTYDQISQAVNEGVDGKPAFDPPITPSGCRAAVNRYVENLLTEDRESAEALRAIDNERLEGMFKRLELAARDNDPKVATRAILAQIKVIERQARLNGLDAPTRHQHEGEIDHHLIANDEHVQKVEREFADRHGEVIELPASAAREVK